MYLWLQDATQIFWVIVSDKKYCIHAAVSTECMSLYLHTYDSICIYIQTRGLRFIDFVMASNPDCTRSVV